MSAIWTPSRNLWSMFTVGKVFRAAGRIGRKTDGKIQRKVTNLPSSLYVTFSGITLCTGCIDVGSKSINGAGGSFDHSYCLTLNLFGVCARNKTGITDIVGTAYSSTGCFGLIGSAGIDVGFSYEYTNIKNWYIIAASITSGTTSSAIFYAEGTGANCCGLPIGSTYSNLLTSCGGTQAYAIGGTIKAIGTGGTVSFSDTCPP